MSAQERERLARELLHSLCGYRGGLAPATVDRDVASLASLLERVEEQAHTEGHESAYVSEIVPCPDCPPGGPYAELCDDCGGSGKDVHLMSPNDAEDRIMKLSDDLTEARERIRELEQERDEARARIANLEGELEYAQAEAKMAFDQVDEARASAAALMAALERMAPRVLCGRCGGRYTRCAACGAVGHTHDTIGSDPVDDPCRNDPVRHAEDCALASTPESVQRFVAEIARKALERAGEQKK